MHPLAVVCPGEGVLDQSDSLQDGTDRPGPPTQDSEVVAMIKELLDERIRCAALSV